MIHRTVLTGAALMFGTLAVSQASASEHVVVILNSGYLPELVSVEMGDTVRFVNGSGEDHALSSSEGVWSTETLENGAEVTLHIDHSMTGRFHGWTDSLIEGQLDLIRRPLTE